MVAEFQHGLIRLDVTLIAVACMLAGFGIAAVWIRLGVAVSRRLYESIALAAILGGTIFLCTFATLNWDFSENRMNSFPKADEAALLQIRTPLRIEVHLAPEDPRRVDLDNRALHKLERLMPKVKIQYISATSIGLFEQTSAHYGEIWYDLGGHRQMSRVMTPQGVLENIYSLAGIAAPQNDDEFRGHPLAVPPRGAVLIFYVLWPVLTITLGFLLQRSQL